VTSSLRWGVLGAAWIADRAMIPAIQAARGCDLVAIASRDPRRAAEMAARHGIARVHPGYDDLLQDPEVDAVYVPLANNLHMPWTLRALAAGKHVLCEKPLAVDSSEGDRMAAAARESGLLLMEAAMYRFHPRMRQLVASLDGVPIRHLYASFGFTAGEPGNYRLQPVPGAGALLDVGFYVADVARWLLGEPDQVAAVMHADAVDMSCSALLRFPGGAQASLYCSFESPEYQELTVVTEDSVIRMERPFSGWQDPHDPYQLMVEEFSEAARSGAPARLPPAPLPLESSLANLRLLDRIRGAARSSREPQLAESAPLARELNGS
jgi:D-xylose 1-dehydrogenase (NADP+, D-xylono-1,5-lactone-forming)